MHVRLVEFTDSDQIVKLGQLYVEEVSSYLPHIEFSEQKIRQTVIDSLTSAHPTIFVAERGGRLVGMLAASIQTFYFMPGHFVQIDILYVHPQSRGSRAAALLLLELSTWSDQIGATVTLGGNSNRMGTDRTAALYERFGYEPVGLSLIRSRGI